MEVNFSGKVFIKQGTIYSYSGNLTFWVKPQREESVPPLVIVSGTGKLLLTDRQTRHLGDPGRERRDLCGAFAPCSHARKH